MKFGRIDDARTIHLPKTLFGKRLAGGGFEVSLELPRVLLGFYTDIASELTGKKGCVDATSPSS
jgi:hypothetical protein